MRSLRRVIGSLALATAVVAVAASESAAQQRGILYRPEARERRPPPPPPQGPGAAQAHDSVYVCRGPVGRVMDVVYEDVKTTSYNWSNTGGGGDGGRFDRTPVLSTTVSLENGTCLDAHFSALVGSKQMYGVASIVMFQVTLTPVTGGAPRHMAGHYETPYGLYGPAVFMEAEQDADAIGTNFFQRVGQGPGNVPPGTYRVDVWWSGGPVGGGGAIGAAFVLKLYFR